MNQMKTHLAKLIALLFVFGAEAACSQTLNWASLSGSTIVDSKGDPLNTTFLFQLGTFDVGFMPNNTNIGQWTAKWHVFDTAAYSYNTTDLGYFTGTEDVQDVPAYASMFEGMKAYLWVRNDTQTEHFLASASTWTFPIKDPGCCPNGLVTSWSVSDLGTGTPIWGSQGSHDGGGDFTSPGPYDVQTHVVPEAGSSLLALIGCGFALLRRRRHLRILPVTTSFLLAAPLIVSRVEGETINWYGFPQKPNLTSTGMDMDVAFQFQLGMFTGGFIPTAENISLWTAHWVPAQTAAYNSTTRAFDTTLTIQGNTAPFIVGAKAYVWGRSTGSDKDEWILFRGTGWTWPSGATMPPNFHEWSAAAANEVILGTVNSGTAFLMKSEAVVSYSQWQNGLLAGEPLNGPNDDPDHDGVPNLLEFVFGTLPGQPGTLQPMTTSLVGVAGQQYLQVAIPRITNHLATVSVEVSDDLIHWQPGDSQTTEVSNTPQALVVRDNTATGPGMIRRFMRLKAVTEP